MKIKNNTTLLITSIICLLPMIFALLIFDKLPALVPIHFDNSGNPDNYLPKTLAVFGMPLFMAGINIFTHFRLNNDPKVTNASSTLRQVMKWAIPILSVIVIPFSLASAIDIKLPNVTAATTLVGVIIVICGNYLPKCRQNYTVGIKLPWTLDSETIWNKTHRFAGFVWVLGGLVVIVNAFFSIPSVNLAVIALLVIMPFIYSYIAYKTERKNDAE